MSLPTDVLIYKLSTIHKDKNVRRLMMFLHLTSVVPVVFLVRPFSNTLESFLIATMLLIGFPQSLQHRPLHLLSWISRWFLIGIITGYGCFIRITFPIFAFPILLFALLHMFIKNRVHGWKFVFTAAAFVSGMLLMILIGIVTDSVYFGYLEVQQTSHDALRFPFSLRHNLTITPLNNFLYNSNLEHLSKHGIHPRYTHLLLNLPQLLGPLIFFSLLQMALFDLFPFIRNFTSIRTKLYWNFQATAAVFSSLAGSSILIVTPLCQVWRRCLWFPTKNRDFYFLPFPDC